MENGISFESEVYNEIRSKLKERSRDFSEKRRQGKHASPQHQGDEIKEQIEQAAFIDSLLTDMINDPKMTEEEKSERNDELKKAVEQFEAEGLSKDIFEDFTKNVRDIAAQYGISI